MSGRGKGRGKKGKGRGKGKGTPSSSETKPGRSSKSEPSTQHQQAARASEGPPQAAAAVPQVQRTPTQETPPSSQEPRPSSQQPRPPADIQKTPTQQTPSKQPRPADTQKTPTQQTPSKQPRPADTQKPPTQQTPSQQPRPPADTQKTPTQQTPSQQPTPSDTQKTPTQQTPSQQPRPPADTQKTPTQQTPSQQPRPADTQKTPTQQTPSQQPSPSSHQPKLPPDTQKTPTRQTTSQQPTPSSQQPGPSSQHSGAAGSTPQKQRPGASVPASQEVARVTQKLGSTTISGEQISRQQRALSPPKRPGLGTVGRHIPLRANFFPLKIPDKLQYIYHYDVDISPGHRDINRDVINQVIAKYKDQFGGYKPAFDGRKNLFCKEKLPLVGSAGVDLNVTLPGKGGGKDRNIKVNVKYAAQVNLNELKAFLSKDASGKMPQECVQALDIILRQMPCYSFTAVGRSFFPEQGEVYPLDNIANMRSGFIQSVRPSQWKTMLVNIDVSSKGFYKEQSVIEFTCEILGIRPQNLADRRFELDRTQRSKLEKELRGVRFQTTHVPSMKRKYTIGGLSRDSADRWKFDVENETTKVEKKMTVTEYFKERYRLNLRYPHLPCLQAGQKKDRLLPMEVCTLIPGPKRNLNELQTAAMIKYTAVPAPERKRKIDNWAREVEQCNREYLLKEYGISMSTEMVKADGRILPAPALILGGSQKENPRDGSWDMRGKRFFSGMPLNSWAIACFSNQKWCGEDILQNFTSQMARVCGQEGIRMNPNPVAVKYVRGLQEIEALFCKWKTEHPELQLIFVVIQQKTKDIYAEVKRVGDNVLGIPTQCVQEKLVKQAKPQVCSNIAMKINAKLGGVNHAVEGLSFPNVIFFGADVTHPGFGESMPSIAAVVGSLDCHASRYCARVRAQTHDKSGGAQEIIKDLAAMVKECLIQFYKSNGQKKPDRIIFYRDGVSEGQFEQVLLHEVRAVQQACVSLEKGYQPKITFLVVQKRHHTRLFCENPRDASGRAQNVPPGTTVDTGITHPFEFDFYLCSHQGIQGTSRPAHYHVLYDDTNFTADQLQKLTFQLCHTYARCTRSVSIPAPAYYAHLVAFRARYHVHIGDRDQGNGIDITESCRNIKVHEDMWKTMYFA